MGGRSCKPGETVLPIPIGVIGIKSAIGPPVRVSIGIGVIIVGIPIIGPIAVIIGRISRPDFEVFNDKSGIGVNGFVKTLGDRSRHFANQSDPASRRDSCRI